MQVTTCKPSDHVTVLWFLDSVKITSDSNSIYEVVAMRFVPRFLSKSAKVTLSLRVRTDNKE